MSRANAINAREAQRIAELLRTLPIAEVQRQTGRCYTTLARIAEAVA